LQLTFPSDTPTKIHPLSPLPFLCALLSTDTCHTPSTVNPVLLPSLPPPTSHWSRSKPPRLPSYHCFHAKKALILFILEQNSIRTSIEASRSPTPTVITVLTKIPLI
jgi:hypothetical protein